jgi:hypothetical protein
VTPKKIEKVAREFGLTVVQGAKHTKLLAPNGRLVAVAAKGSKQRERGPLTPEDMLRADIRRGLRSLQ